jgi:predicted Fe-S protein YdhL (DUF1289 family)
MNVLEHAKQYIDYGWKPIPIPYMSKAANIIGWNKLNIDKNNLNDYFKEEKSNIGVLLGSVSQWLTDIDLDCDEAVKYAKRYLPRTLKFGRKSKPSSHWLYRSKDSETCVFRYKDESGQVKTLLEIRSTGLQTVFPPSVNPTGEDVNFEDGNKYVIEIDFNELKHHVTKLAVACVLSRCGYDDDFIYNLNLSDHNCLPKLPEKTMDSILLWYEIKQEKKQIQENITVKEAVEKYNSEHKKSYPKIHGNCPMCGHKECFNAAPDDDQRWFCFSASHDLPGIRHNSSVSGDSLDIDSFLAGIDRFELLRREGYLTKTQKIENKPTIETSPDCLRTIVFEVGDGHEAVNQSVNVLIDSNTVYQRGQKLVEVIENIKNIDNRKIKRDIGAPVISQISQPRVWEVLSRGSTWERPTKNGNKKCDPPHQVVSCIHSRGHWEGLPELRGIVTIPILRQDGSLHSKQGYDQETGLYYSPSCEIMPILPSPTQTDALACGLKILDVVVDFPFLNDACKSAWLSTVLARVGWGAFNGGAPLTIIDGTTPGTGKTLLADVSALISTGNTASRSPYVEDNDEMRKGITSNLLAGDQISLIDNAPAGASIGWPCLDAALTGDVWADRELGKNTKSHLAMDTMFFVTGNNLSIGADASRRSLRIRLESDEEHPEHRTNFKYDPLVEYIRSERPMLLNYAFTMLRAYIVAGCPKLGLNAMGSFDGWSNLIRSTIVWAGFADPCDARINDEDDMDQEAQAHITLLSDWELLPDQGGISCKRILDEISNQNEAYDNMRDAIMTLCPTRDGSLPSSKSLGRKFRSLKGRVKNINGKKMKIVQSFSSNKIIMWKTQIVNKEDVGLRDIMGIFTPPVNNNNNNNNNNTYGHGGKETLQTNETQKIDENQDNDCPF